MEFDKFDEFGWFDEKGRKAPEGEGREGGMRGEATQART